MLRSKPVLPMPTTARPTVVPDVTLDALNVAETPGCRTACGGGTASGATRALDEQLWAKRFASGDDAALQAVIERYQTRVERLAGRLLAWPADVADVVQDVFVAAIEAR